MKAAIGEASSGCGGGQRISRRSCFVHCRAVPLHQNRRRRLFRGRPQSFARLDSRLVRFNPPFVLQAEVFHLQVNDLVRQYYPTIIGRTVNFSLPAGASGLTVEAELNGTDIEFPLGPQPVLSWADCKVSVSRDRAAAYRCELKPWCRFR